MKEKIKVLIDEETVNKRIQELADLLSEKYEGKDLHLVGVLKGSVFFMCELAKCMKIPVTIDFMSVSSYGDAMESSGHIEIHKDLDESIEGRHVLVVEDILDSGRTLYMLKNLLQERNPASMEVCTLLDKPDRRVVPVEVDYAGFEIPDAFVVGYGLDYQQRHRNLNYIGVVELCEEKTVASVK